MKPAKLFRRWCAQQARLLRELGQRLRRVQHTGEAEEVHQLRVVARRLRLFVRLGAAWYGKQTSSRFRDWSRTLSLATDQVRDIDVTLEWMTACPRPAPGATRELRRRRQRLLRSVRRRLRRFPAGLRRALTTPEGGRKHELRLYRRCDRLLSRLRQRARKEAPLFFRLPVPAQHDFRRIVRRWRYLRELELPDNRHRKDPLLRRLLKLQEVLGDRQNLLLAEDVIAALPPDVETRGLLRRLRAELRLVEESIRKRL